MSAYKGWGIDMLFNGTRYYRSKDGTWILIDVTDGQFAPLLFTTETEAISEMERIRNKHGINKIIAVDINLSVTPYI